MKSKILTAVVLCTIAASTTTCRSHGVDVTIRNDGQSAIHNLEFDYPGAAFGTGSLAPGASFSYHIKPLSRGEVGVSFEQEDGKMFRQKGPTVIPNQDERLLIVVEQDGNKQWRVRAEQR
ncbi:MAG: hypothetical protein DMG64_05365 [Acidobacteria bacterium]|nr:MAG: hypothetical protein DMG64_05365 [Acidobacteriota bacterium]